MKARLRLRSLKGCRDKNLQVAREQLSRGPGGGLEERNRESNRKHDRRRGAEPPTNDTGGGEATREENYRWVETFLQLVLLEKMFL